MRRACNITVAPLTASMANTAHAISESLPPTACTIMMGNTTMGVTLNSADWSPSPSASSVGGVS